MESFTSLLTLDKIKSAYEGIKPHVDVTPVLVNESFNDRHGRKFFFKCENMQRTGSFKIRGAMNAVRQLRANNNDATGVFTTSSGNHGLAVALAAKTHGFPCTIITPKTSPGTKQRAIVDYGASLVLCEPTMHSRDETVKELRNKLGYHYIPSADDYDVITGQATIGLELLDQVPELDAILVSVAGGGMAAGICMVAKHLKPELKVFIVEPAGKQLEKFLRAGERLWPYNPRYLDTIADGLRQQETGLRNLPILLEYAEKDVFSMSEDEIIGGTKAAFEELKVVVEPSAGICVAAAMSSKIANLDPSIQNVGIILCGGNVDLDKVLPLISSHRETGAYSNGHVRIGFTKH